MFEWKPEYSCNVKEIDEQHRRLFAIVAELYDIAQRHDGFDYYDEIQRLFGELKDYTVYHFGYEEKLLTKLGYDKTALRMHQMEHGAFVNKMVKLNQEDLDKDQKKVLLETLIFAADWIEKHILNTDKQYREFLNTHGIR